MRRISFTKLGWVIPGAVMIAAGGGIWLGLGRKGDGMTLVGWVGVMLLLATFLGIFCGCQARNAWQLLATFGGIVGGGAIVIGGISFWTHLLSVGQGVELVAIFAGWVGLWSAGAWAMRRWGRGVACAVVMTGSMLFFASPIILVPAVRGVGGPSAWRPLLLSVVRHGCPMFAIMEAVRPQVRIDWPVLPGVYGVTGGLWQEVPVELPGGWESAAGYICAGLLIAGAGVWRDKKSKRKRV